MSLQNFGAVLVDPETTVVLQLGRGLALQTFVAALACYLEKIMAVHYLARIYYIVALPNFAPLYMKSGGSKKRRNKRKKRTRKRRQSRKRSTKC